MDILCILDDGDLVLLEVYGVFLEVDGYFGFYFCGDLGIKIFIWDWFFVL